MKKFYLHNGTEQDGPFDISDLKAKNITKQTEIWHEGLPDWTKAGEIDELNELFKQTTPPPIKPKVNYQNAKPKPKAYSFTKSLTILGVIILVFVGIFVIVPMIDTNNYNSDLQPETYVEKKMTIEEIENSQPTQFITVEGQYNKSFWGTKIKLNGNIRNQATIADYKDVTIRVTYYTKTKSILTTQDHTIYEVFQPNSITPFNFSVDNYQDVDSIGLGIVNAIPN